MSVRGAGVPRASTFPFPSVPPAVASTSMAGSSWMKDRRVGRTGQTGRNK